jgi:AcrR family transcriptional regulator
MATETEATRSPGRPRSPEADTAIVQATLELLADVGYRSMTMEQVRARSGVGKATIYRRYANKDELVRAAMVHLHHDLPVPEDTGSLRGDIEEVLEAAVGAALETGAGHVVPRLLGESAADPELQRLFHDNLVAPRRRVVRAVFDRAVQRGEVRDDVDLDLVIDLLVGSIMYRGMISGMDPVAMAGRFGPTLDVLLEGVSPR